MTKKHKIKATLAARAQKRAAARNPQAAARAGGAEPEGPPYGYVEVEGELQPSPEEGEVIERIRALAEKHLSPDAIAKALTAEGLVARGVAWDKRQVTRILRRKVTRAPGSAGGR